MATFKSTLNAKRKNPAPAFAILASALLAGCGGGGATDAPQSSGSDALNNSIVQGSAIKGAISNGVVKAYLVQTVGGEKVKVDPALPASTRTDSDGNYRLDLGDDYSGETLLIEVSADSATRMACDVTNGCGKDVSGNPIDFGQSFAPGNDFVLNGLVQVDGSGNIVEAPITALTHMMVARAGAAAGGLSSQNIVSAQRYIEETFDLDLGTMDLSVADLTRLDEVTDYSKAQLEQGVISAALLSLVNTPDWDSIDEVLQDVSQRLASGGQIANVNLGALRQVTLDDVFYRANEIAGAVAQTNAQSGYSSSLAAISSETQASYDDVTQEPEAVDPVVITSSPQGISVEEGQRVALSVVAQGGGELRYQWRKDSQNISGATSATYTITSAALSDAGSYDVVVSNSVGSAPSLSALVRVTPAPLEPVSITSSPQPQTVDQGREVTFSVAATGGGVLAYQWRKDGVAISGATASSYQIIAAQPSHAGSYTVAISNAESSVVSLSAALQVTPTPVAPVSIVSNPKALTVDEGAQAIFSVAAQGGGPIRFQWRKNGLNLSGQTSATLTIRSVALDDRGTYDVIVSNSVSTRTSQGAVLQVTPTPVVPVSITSNPQNVSVKEGESATFSVGANGDGPLSYQWRKDGVNIAGATSSSFTLNAAALQHRGSYDVIVSNSAGSKTSLAALLQVTEVQVEPIKASVDLSWDIPTEREDGTALELYEINGYTIRYGTRSGALSEVVQVSGASVTTTRVENLPAGTHYFAIATVDSDGVRGAFSGEISQVIP